MATPNIEWTTVEWNVPSDINASCPHLYAEECSTEDGDEDSGPGDGPSGETEAV